MRFDQGFYSDYCTATTIAKSWSESVPNKKFYVVYHDLSNDFEEWEVTGDDLSGYPYHCYYLNSVKHYSK